MWKKFLDWAKSGIVALFAVIVGIVLIVGVVQTTKWAWNTITDSEVRTASQSSQSLPIPERPETLTLSPEEQQFLEGMKRIRAGLDKTAPRGTVHGTTPPQVLREGETVQPPRPGCVAIGNEYDPSIRGGVVRWRCPAPLGG